MKSTLATATQLAPTATRELPAYLNERQVAAYLHVSVLTVRRWRWSKQGPKWVKYPGAVRYSFAALEEWIRSRPTGGGC